MIKSGSSIMAVLFSVILAAGCASTPKAGPLSKIVISPEKGQVKINKSIDLTAKGYDSKGRAIAINPLWRVTVNAKSGVLTGTQGEKVSFTGKAAGVSTIVADFKGFTSKATIEVVK